MNTYFDPTRFASLTDARRKLRGTLGLDVLIADLAQLPPTFTMSLEAICKSVEEIWQRYCAEANRSRELLDGYGRRQAAGFLGPWVPTAPS